MEPVREARTEVTEGARRVALSGQQHHRHAAVATPAQELQRDAKDHGNHAGPVRAGSTQGASARSVAFASVLRAFLVDIASPALAPSVRTRLT
ncbi:hypothetical protein D7Y11_03670 [Corallococcus sp. AB018]|nr:hypothetical protein D7Y11_03670 [Corallococcus sp. AB018]